MISKLKHEDSNQSNMMQGFKCLNSPSATILRSGRNSRVERYFLPALAFLLLVTGCAGKVVVPQKPQPPPPISELPRVGYSIQAGAFSILDNAILLTKSLERRGLNGYYFRHKTGLYKVRFGDFPSKETARAKAESLNAAGIVDEYYIVSPDDYALARTRVYASKNLRIDIVETAESFIGLPYRWGGSSANEGFDCSGLAMAVYQLNGLNLPRSSREQYMVGTPVRRGELAEGDLVFFATSRGKKVSHVGVYAGSDSFIHAPGRGKTIRVDSLSSRYYGARYVGAKKYLR